LRKPFSHHGAGGVQFLEEELELRGIELLALLAKELSGERIEFLAQEVILLPHLRHLHLRRRQLAVCRRQLRLVFGDLS